MATARSIPSAGIVLFSLDGDEILLLETFTGNLELPRLDRSDPKQGRCASAARALYKQCGLSHEQAKFIPCTVQHPVEEINELNQLEAQYFVGCADSVLTHAPDYDRDEFVSVRWYTLVQAMQSRYLFQRRKDLIRHALELYNTAHDSGTLIPGTQFLEFDDTFVCLEAADNCTASMRARKVNDTSRVPWKQHTNRKRESVIMRQLSHTLTWALRHGALELGLPIDAQGYVPLQALLQKPELHGATREHVLQIVQAENTDNRFGVRRDGDGVEYVRANNGHSITLPVPPAVQREAGVVKGK